MRKIITVGMFLILMMTSFGKTYNAKTLYRQMKLKNRINYKTFVDAVNGYNRIKKNKSDKIVVVDFTQASTKKRFYVFDLKRRKIIYHTYVSHGINTGSTYARRFSNRVDSRKSSLGFYKTAETYIGKHGYSLRLDGLEKGINDNARRRAIVIHGAKYANSSSINKERGLGRSWGCPALPSGISKNVINLIKNGTVMYVAGKDSSYKKKSRLL